MPTTVVSDWREASEQTTAGLFAAEIGRWFVALGWDTAASWQHVELGRRLGTVPGLIARDEAGAVAGWTFYILHNQVLQIGGLVARSDTAASALLDGIFASPIAARAQSVTAFAFSDVPRLADLLTARGLRVAGYDYLARSLSSTTAPVAVDAADRLALRVWDAADLPAAAALLGRAYPGADVARPFAPAGTNAEWREYAGQLVAASGCGTIMPSGSFVAADGANRLAGVVLVTRLSASTAHIAQIAVDPEAQGRGLGAGLVDAACASARAAGCDHITLLVDARNARARRLYDHAGFAPVTQFVAAGGRP